MSENSSNSKVDQANLNESSPFYKEVLDLLSETLELSQEDKDGVSADSRFIEDMKLDSLSTVDVIMALEDRFDIEISDEEAQKILTFGDAVLYVQNHAKSKDD